ncbi:hypothetical protein SVIOM342S_05279 [Streptomyces violaceorubidus]
MRRPEAARSRKAEGNAGSAVTTSRSPEGCGAGVAVCGTQPGRWRPRRGADAGGVAGGPGGCTGAVSAAAPGAAAARSSAGSVTVCRWARCRATEATSGCSKSNVG